MEEEKIPYSGCVFTPDHSLLVTTHWDSHCSFLCSSKEKIDTFEGFYCTSKTEVFWSLYDM